MRQIGFKNFRKFEDFHVIDLSPITIFVGENNAGKSTVVKAMLSIVDFLKSSMFDDIPSEAVEKDFFDRAKETLLNKNFYFNKNYFAHIGTFSRAIYNKSIDNKITFVIAIEDYKYEVTVEGNKRDYEAVSAKVVYVKVHKAKYNIDFEFDLKDRKITYVFHPGLSPLYIKENNSISEDEEDNDEKDEFTKKFMMFQGNRKKILDTYIDYSNSFSKDVIITTDLSFGTLRSLSSQFIDNLMSYACDRLIASLNVKDEIEDPFGINDYKNDKLVDIIKDIPKDSMQFIDTNKRIIKEMLRTSHFAYELQARAKVEYFYAHAVTQAVIYSAKDTNDYLVKTIHEFANARIKRNSKADKFIKKWMDIFNIGRDYEIISVGGEAHIVKIKNKDGDSLNLSDKGMGSIQLMVLLFRIATLLGKRGDGHATIIIEEPEQNIHPMLQSKLADLFYELNKDYGFKFIIETHSEYLVRRSQVIVAAENKKSKEKLKKWLNPFKVYYFPADGYPYDMEYAPDGYFEKPFGKGFFNVSSELSLDLDRVEQGIYDEGQD